MSQLEKAILHTANANGPFGDPIPVQFNPSSLKLQITNQVEGGVSRAKQQRQFTGVSSTTLTLELIFDTSDEGTTDTPVSVRTKTRQIEQFVYPRDEKTNSSAPPMLHFHWADLVLQGVVESVSLDLEHFAANGTPLRARVGLSFKEQNAKYEPQPKNAGPRAPRPGQASLGVAGSFGAGFSAGANLGLGVSAGFSVSAGFGGQVGFALGGESAAEFAARVGVDPTAWRGLVFEGGAGGSLSLDAGMEVGLSANFNATAGIGVFAGASAGASASLEASFGLKAEAGVTALAGVGANAELQQGFSLSAAGGVGAAIESVKMAKAEAAVNQTRQAFATAPANNGLAAAASSPAAASSVAGPAVTTRPSMPEQSRTPTRLSGLPSPAAQQAAPAAPPPPRADPRATAFGFGVPLRPVIRQAALERTGSLQGRVPLEAKAAKGDVPVTSDPTVPPWMALPAADPGRKASDIARKKGRCHPPCGCIHRPKHCE